MRHFIPTLACIPLAASSFAQSSAFTYQGELTQDGVPANGAYDMRFRVFDAAVGGSAVGSIACVDNVSVSEGRFTALVDTVQQFAQQGARFIEIEVRQDSGLTCANTTGYTTLTPRQEITPAPRAMTASFAHALAAPDGVPQQAVFVDNSGNVGIGTTTPTGRLHVVAPTGGSTPGEGGRIQGTAADVTNQSYLAFNNSAGTRMGFVGDGSAGDNAVFLAADSGDIVLNTQAGRSLVVSPSGNVGIGTASPANKLHLTKTGGAGTAGGPAILLQDTGSNSSQSGYVGFWNGSGTETGWMGFGSTFDPDLSIVNARSGGDIVLSTFGGGKVGVGTSAPTAKLHVAGSSRLDVNTFSDVLRIINVNGDMIWAFGVQALGNPPNPALGMYSPISGDVQAGMHRSIDGGVGEVYAERKSFRVPNPSDATSDIWYCCPEGPEAAMYVRGTAQLVEGSARITLPEHFRSLAVEEGMTVQVTPLSAESKGLAITSKRLAGIEVRELAGGTGNYEFDWRIEAVRKGHENYQVIRPWMRSDEDESKAWDNRMKEIAERRANGMP